MKANEWQLFGCIVVTALATCALADDRPAQAKPARPGTPQAESAVARRAKTAARPDLPVIGYLEKRGQTITIKAGSNGAVYSARTTQGKILFENLTGEQLRAQAPEIHQFIKSAVAKGSGGSGVVLDASVR